MKYITKLYYYNEQHVKRKSNIFQEKCYININSNSLNVIYTYLQ